MPMTEPADRDTDVGITYFGPDFALTIRWTTSADTDDETRAEAAASWFADTYGFDPSEHAERVTVAPLPHLE
jgi:hypothetical protein